jgi:predicted transcriptional regulator
VRDAVPDDFARTTVLTVLRILEEKGHVKHVVEGKAHRYVPTVEPDVAGKSALSRILATMFAGQPELLLAQLVSDRQIDHKKLQQLRAVLDARLAVQDGRDDV